MRVSVIGAGAIGGWLASGFVEAGATVTVLARGATLEALRRSGNIVVTSGETRREFSVDVTDRPDALRGADLLVLGLKAHDLPAAAPLITEALGKETFVAAAINGLPWWYFESFGGPARGLTLDAVDPGGVLARLMPAERVVGTVVHAASRVEAPGEIRLIKADRVWLGDAGDNHFAGPVAELLSSGGVPATATEHIHREVWSKLWGNSNMNPLTALARADASQLLDDPGGRGLVVAMMREMAALGERIGLSGFDDFEGRINETRKLGAIRTSMLQDIEAGREIEIGPILGCLVELAQHLGQPTPVMAGISGLARLLDKNLREKSA